MSGDCNFIAQALERLRARRPLVHNITNYVVMNFTANTLLSLGASPLMAHAEEEVAELANITNALVVNIGTLSTPWVKAMFLAARAARAKNIPIVFDPVGSGATSFRTLTSRRFVEEIKPTVLRANASEILSFAAQGSGGKGVDATHTVEQARVTAIALARKYGITVAVTGAEDFISDGHREARVNNGDPLMSYITGSGCAASAITAAFCAVEPDAFKAAVAALTVLDIAGECAASDKPRPGTFMIKLLDELNAIDASRIQTMSRVSIAACRG